MGLAIAGSFSEYEARSLHAPSVMRKAPLALAPLALAPLALAPLALVSSGAGFLWRWFPLALVSSGAGQSCERLTYFRSPTLGVKQAIVASIVTELG